jgi:hypothetical protein
LAPPATISSSNKWPRQPEPVPDPTIADPAKALRHWTSAKAPPLPRPATLIADLIRDRAAEIKPLASNAILAVGDSFTAGSEVDEHQTYSAQLEVITGWPVINGGVGGYGTDQMILAAERFIPLLHPAMIVVGILDNDISRSGYRTYGGAPKPWFEVNPDNELVHHNNPVPPQVPRDQNSSAPWFAYSDLAIWTMGRLGGRSDLLAIRAELYEPANNDPVAVSCALLRRLQRTTEAEHIRLLVLMIYGGIDNINILELSFQRQQAVAVASCARDLRPDWSPPSEARAYTKWIALPAARGGTPRRRERDDD